MENIFCRSLTLCIGPDSEHTKLLDHPKQNPRRGGGLRQTCPHPTLYSFYQMTHAEPYANNVRELSSLLSVGFLMWILGWVSSSTAVCILCMSHRLNMELDLQSLFGLCVQLYSLAETPQPQLPPHLGSYTGALLVSQHRRHLFVTPWYEPLK